MATTTNTRGTKQVRFSPFVTYLSEIEPDYPDLDESINMEGLASSKKRVSSSRRWSNSNKFERGSINLIDVFGIDSSFGLTNLSIGSSSGGSSFGLSGSDFSLGGSSNQRLTIQEEGEGDEDEYSEEELDCIRNKLDAIDRIGVSDSEDLDKHSLLGNASFSISPQERGRWIRERETIFSSLLNSSDEVSIRVDPA